MIYRVDAYNLSRASENKIHDDSVAKKLGFTGGLVVGVEIYAYMTHPAVAKWGRAWLERGAMEVRFSKPVYDGRIAEITDTEAERDALAIALTSETVACASGTARLGPAAEVQSIPDLASLPLVRPPANRPPADEISLAEGTLLGIEPRLLTREAHADYLRDVREDLAIYTAEQVAHPGWLLRGCNAVLRDSVVLAPWIHTGSKVQNYSVLRVGQTLTARARVVANYERRGHRFVDIDIVLVADDTTVVARVLHTAAYRLRQLA